MPVISRIALHIELVTYLLKAYCVSHPQHCDGAAVLARFSLLFMGSVLPLLVQRALILLAVLLVGPARHSIKFAF